jgi:predicted DCC family thiol-disulfide oxidoreductase YuxK
MSLADRDGTVADNHGERQASAVVVATVVYDGDCGFCTAFVRAAERRLHVPVKTVPWQGAPLEQLGVTQAGAERALQWVVQDGSRREGHLAIAAWL